MPARRSRGASDPEKLTGARLVEEVADLVNLPASDVQAVWDRALACVRDAIIDGRSVVLMNVGTLDPVLRAARRGFDPTSREYVRRKARRSVRFTPSRNLRDIL